ncbi:uncharacterized protein LOC113562215 [Ooceraea biroi]|uniref:uncharacterized protein LOC113562215 n=1 Tax=Ooceraea biroi TaxID=2015173 RepID=UPI000F095A25|nr:uncharacterized protein LOC113562215 [Ooceraea biroi]
MSKSSVDSTIDEQDGRDQDDRDKSSAKIMKRLKALFCFCFKREPRAGEIVEYDPDEYDYIVEKLVVRRVPLAFFAIAADLQDLRRQTPSMSSQSTSSSTVSWSKPTVNVVTQATSTRSVIDRTAYDFTANKALRFDTDGNRVPIMKRQVHLIIKKLNFEFSKLLNLNAPNKSQYVLFASFFKGFFKGLFMHRRLNLLK